MADQNIDASFLGCFFRLLNRSGGSGCCSTRGSPTFFLRVFRLLLDFLGFIQETDSGLPDLVFGDGLKGVIVLFGLL